MNNSYDIVFNLMILFCCGILVHMAEALFLRRQKPVELGGYLCPSQPTTNDETPGLSGRLPPKLQDLGTFSPPFPGYRPPPRLTNIPKSYPAGSIFVLARRASSCFGYAVSALIKQSGR